MSEVLAFCGHGPLLVTGLTNLQSVHTAEVVDAQAILYVNDKRPDAQVWPWPARAACPSCPPH